MTTTQTTVQTLKINRLTKTQYEAQTSIGVNELSLVDPEFTGSKVLVTDSNSDIVESSITTTELGYLDNASSNIQTQIDNKQATLVSGTNIKTINNTSLLGSGNVSTSKITMREW